MPFPTPNTDESHDDFISRCMANPTMNSEFPDNEQRAAVCQSQWGKDMSDDDKTMKHFAYIGKTDSIDRETRTLVAKVSTDKKDRDGEVLLPKGVNLENFKKNPVVQWAHGCFGEGPPGENNIGKALWIKAEKDGIVAKVQFAAHEAATRVFELFAGGFLNAWSVGFIPGASHEPTEKELEKRPDWAGVHRIFDEWEMLEFSAVSIPANADALTLAVSKGLTLPEGLESPEKKIGRSVSRVEALEISQAILKRAEAERLAMADADTEGAEETSEIVKQATHNATWTFDTQEEADEFKVNMEKLQQECIDAAKRKEEPEGEPWDGKINSHEHRAVIGALDDKEAEYLCIDGPEGGIRTIKADGKTVALFYGSKIWDAHDAMRHARDNGAIEFQRAAPEITVLEVTPNQPGSGKPAVVAPEIDPAETAAPKITVVGDMQGVIAEVTAFRCGRVTF